MDSASTDSRSMRGPGSAHYLLPFSFFISFSFCLCFSSPPSSPSHETYVSTSYYCHCLTCHLFPLHFPSHFFAKDPFAPSDGNTDTASSGLDLFDVMTVESNNLGSSLDACFSSVAPQSCTSPSPSPLFASASSTITTTATISAPISPSTANPATDLFGKC